MTFIATKWTTEDYHCMIAAGILDERKVELLKGEIVEMSPEGEAHAYRSHQADKYCKTSQKIYTNIIKYRRCSTTADVNNDFCYV